MFTNVGLTVEMYFKYILRKKNGCLGIFLFLVSHIGTGKNNNKFL